MSDGNGPWRDGRYVVANAASAMPERCMVCAARVPALKEEPLPVPRGIPARGIVGATQFMLGPRFSVRYGRCDSHRIRWMKLIGMIAGISTIVGMLGAVGCLIANDGRFSFSEVAFGSVFVVALVAIICAGLADIRIAKVEGDTVWIGGFKEPYLATLPGRNPSAP